MNFIDKILKAVKPTKKFEQKYFSDYLSRLINDSANYIEVYFLTDHLELKYWVKDPYKYVKTLILFYDDYDLEILDRYEDIISLRNCIYLMMNLKDKHILYKDKEYHHHQYNQKLMKEGVPCIRPKRDSLF